MPEVSASSGGAATAASGYDEHKARTPPPDLPSLLLDSRIVYLGMPVCSMLSQHHYIGTAGLCSARESEQPES